ncbi:APC family permease [Streptomyces sp. NPDC058735]|uniref:APC family permease n=1 Tax=unclassified Streptomyces TaxID=2593676 RepID=UPI0036A25F1A
MRDEHHPHAPPQVARPPGGRVRRRPVFRDGNLTPFSPSGLAGIGARTAAAFFSCIGFDAITTAGEEAGNPRRDIPVAILVCIGRVTLLYCAVALAATGAIGGDAAGGRPAALSYVVDQVTGSAAGGAVIAFGAVVAIASVVLAVMCGQTRILMSMSRDGLIPRVFENVSPKTSTPVAGTLIAAVVFALPVAFAPLDAVVDLCAIGTLAVMAVVTIAVIAPRRREPGLARTFGGPLSPVTPLLGVGFCLYLMYETGRTAWIQCAVFLAAGVALYLLHERRNSRLASLTPTDAAEPARQPA